MRFLRLVGWVGVALLLAGTVVSYPQLPATIPQHIDAGGKPGNFVARSPLAWGWPVLLTLLLMILNEGLRAWLPKRPELFNFPGKEQLLRLPAEYRGEVVLRMQHFLDLMSVQLVVTFALVQWMQWRGAHGATSEALTVTLIVGPSLVMGVVGLFLRGLQEAVDRAQRRYESRRHPQHP
ncbi:MAG: DUF1648 domain-containing protein [Gemmatimonas sp.]